MNFFKRRYRKIKEQADKFASTKNVPSAAYSLYHIILWVMIASSVMTVLTLYGLLLVELPEHPAVTISLNMLIPAWGIILFFGFGKYFFYARILEIHYFSKAIAFLIKRLDMYWWRKYRKQSPLTESLFKIQTKSETAKRRLSKKQIRLIQIALIATFVILYGYSEIDTFEGIVSNVDQSIEQEQKTQNNLGKIFDGMEKKIVP